MSADDTQKGPDLSRAQAAHAGHGLRRVPHIALFFLFWAVLAVLLLMRITERPLFSEEIPAAQAMAQSPKAAIEASARDGRLPLFYWLCSWAGLAQRRFGLPAISPRLLSAFFAWLAFLPAYRLMRSASHLNVYGHLFCALFVASPFWIEMGRIACPYSLLGLLALVSTSFLFSLFKAPRFPLWLGYLIAAALTLYADWMAVAVFVAHGLTAPMAASVRSDRFGWRHAFGLAVAWLVAAAAFAPWLLLGAGRLVEAPWLLMGRYAPLDMLQYAGFSAGYTLYMFLFGDSMAPWNALRAALLSLPALVAACYGVERAFRSHNRPLRRALAFGVIGFAVSVAVLSVLSIRPHPFFVPPRLAFLFPFGCVALAYGFGAMNKVVSFPLVAVLLASNSWSLINGSLQREYTNWAYVTPINQILGAIAWRSAPDSLLIIDTYNLKQVDYYYRGDLPRLRLQEDLDSAEDFAERFKPYQRALFVHGRRDRSADQRIDRVNQSLEEQFQRRETQVLLAEDPAVSEIKGYLCGAPVDPAKIVLDVYEREKDGRLNVEYTSRHK